ncbi:MAG: T9SS C-terminal target domain-containing protein [Ignavibacteriae bacterium]|nr:MAG: T9SS C-terminal target domain-containing protein [Ignavibacteriota bacterium]
MCKRNTIFTAVYCILFVLTCTGALHSQGVTDEYGYTIGGNYVLSGLNSFSSYANIPHNNMFNQPAHGTIEMWIYPVNGSAFQTLLAKGPNEASSFLFGIQSSYLRFKIGATLFSNTAGTTIPNNQWTHVAVTWSSVSYFTVNFYVNGALSGSALNLNATWVNNADAIRIGANQYNYNQPFNGKIDEVRFWNVVRSASLIAANRFTGIGDITGANTNSAITSGYNYAGLVSSWTFNNTSSVIDGISGFNGTYVGSAVATFQDAGIPMPYNIAMMFPGGTQDYLVINTSTLYNQTGDGSIEMWIKPSSFSKDQTLISKGATSSTITFLFGISSAGKLLFRTASNAIASTGPSLDINKWNHVAVAWSTSGSFFNINFFLNGNINGATVQIPNLMPINTNNIYIGSSQALPNSAFTGYIDEVRLWNPTLNAFAIQNNMFVSSRVIQANSSLLAAYIFDGNLNNLTNQAGINASLNNGGTNNSRFSGYISETSTGYFPTTLCAHTTTINRGGSPNSFPIGFSRSSDYILIPDNNTSGITDSIFVTNPTGSLFNIEVFLSIEHTYVGDLIVSLQGPNGISKILLNRNGGALDNVLTFVGDAFANLPNAANYYPPWAFIKPMDPMGTFNGSTIQGTWILKCIDAAATNTGALKGWGVRLNYSVNIEKTSEIIPTKFQLSQNYPNPFNPVTNINFDLAKSTDVKITLFDMLGREVKVIANEFKNPGSYTLKFDASTLASGTYFYKIEAGEFTDVKKMVLIK